MKRLPTTIVFVVGIALGSTLMYFAHPASNPPPKLQNGILTASNTLTLTPTPKPIQDAKQRQTEVPSKTLATPRIIASNTALPAPTFEGKTEANRSVQNGYEVALLTQVIRKAKIAMSRPMQGDTAWTIEFYKQLEELSKYDLRALKALEYIRQGIVFVDDGRIEEGLEILEEIRESGQ